MMKKVIAFSLLIISLLLIACAPPPSSSDLTRDRQETSLREGAAEVGIPSIVNFRELKLAKDIYELRDQTGLVTYSYIENQIQSIVPGLTVLGGKLTFLCTSIGYPLPYAVQFSAPESVQTYNLNRTGGSGERYYGAEVLPQAEQNACIHRHLLRQLGFYAKIRTVTLSPRSTWNRRLSPASSSSSLIDSFLNAKGLRVISVLFSLWFPLLH